MFVHSERVPRLYKIASKYLKEVTENGSSLKDLVYTQTKFPNIKALFALLTKTLQHYSEINDIITKSQLLLKEPKFDPWLARVLITQLFWSNKGLEGTCKPIATILSYRDTLESYKSNTNDERPVSKVLKPRYVRVNTLLISLEEAINGFCSEGWELVPFDGKTYNDFISNIRALQNYQFMVDVHVKELFVFPPKTEFFQHDAYKCKSILLQDKASCLTVQLLNATPGSTVLDMCAAPGMKTTFLAACLNNQGTIYAIEIKDTRYQTLNTVIQESYATCVKTINKDALTVTSEDCPNVEYILVDPSCSGSGISDRIKINDELEEPNQNRLRKLFHFQQMLLKHALQNFPEAKRVVYSTCSIYEEENEFVVNEVLKDNINFKLASAYELLNFPFKKPKKRGDHLDYIRRCCIRTTTENDLTNGFFIAVFERSDKTLLLQEQSVCDEKKIKEKWNNEVTENVTEILNSKEKNAKKKSVKCENVTKNDIERKNKRKYHEEKDDCDSKKKKNKVKTPKGESDSVAVKSETLENMTNIEDVKKMKKKKKRKDTVDSSNTNDIKNVEVKIEVLDDVKRIVV